MSKSVPLIGFGKVRHTRLRPHRHAFVYPTYFLMLPLRSLQRQAPQPGQWHINRPGALSFFETDHGDGRLPEQGGAIAWLDEVLQREGIHDATGEAWLHTYPRVLGYTFKPVSFWHCHRAADDQGGALRAIVVEVNNTFGERHCYLFPEPKFGRTEHANKVFHVSPFCEVKGQYDFRFMRTHQAAVERIVARVDHGDDKGPLIQTSISGALVPATRKEILRTFWRYPFFTFAVVLRIHWHALLLWLKRVPFITKPEPPSELVSRGQASPTIVSKIS